MPKADKNIQIKSVVSSNGVELKVHPAEILQVLRFDS